MNEYNGVMYERDGWNLIVKCGQCQEKAISRIQIGEFECRWLCRKHYTIYMEKDSEQPVVFKRASEL